MASTITFLGQTFNRADLDQVLINYIDTYNQVANAPKGKSPMDNDFHFRLIQAQQTFGNDAVVDQIQYLISLLDT